MITAKRAHLLTGNTTPPQNQIKRQSITNLSSRIMATIWLLGRLCRHFFRTKCEKKTTWQPWRIWAAIPPSPFITKSSSGGETDHLYIHTDGWHFVNYPMRSRHTDVPPLKDAAPTTQRLQNKGTQHVKQKIKLK